MGICFLDAPQFRWRGQISQRRCRAWGPSRHTSDPVSLFFRRLQRPPPTGVTAVRRQIGMRVAPSTPYDGSAGKLHPCAKPNQLRRTRTMRARQFGREIQRQPGTKPQTATTPVPDNTMGIKDVTPKQSLGDSRGIISVPMSRSHPS